MLQFPTKKRNPSCQTWPLWGRVNRVGRTSPRGWWRFCWSNHQIRKLRVGAKIRGAFHSHRARENVALTAPALRFCSLWCHHRLLTHTERGAVKEPPLCQESEKYRLRENALQGMHALHFTVSLHCDFSVSVFTVLHLKKRLFRCNTELILKF